MVHFAWGMASPIPKINWDDWSIMEQERPLIGVLLVFAMMCFVVVVVVVVVMMCCDVL